MTTTVTKKDEAYRSIRQAIISGELEPGEILSIVELSKRFGVGKTPAREALLVLAFEGWIDPIPRSGYMITPVTIRDVLEVFHLRMLMEVEAIGLAVGRISDEDICALEDNNKREKRIFNALPEGKRVQSYREGYELNREFHLTIARASGNLRLVRLMEQLLGEIERILARDPYIADPHQHTQILEPLKRRDKSGAQEAMRAHLEETKARLLDRF